MVHIVGSYFTGLENEASPRLASAHAHQTISFARNFSRFFAFILLSFDLSKFVSGPRSDESLTIRIPDSRDSCALLSCLRGSGIRKCEEGFKRAANWGR